MRSITTSSGPIQVLPSGPAGTGNEPAGEAGPTTQPPISPRAAADPPDVIQAPTATPETWADLYCHDGSPPGKGPPWLRTRAPPAFHATS